MKIEHADLKNFLDKKVIQYNSTEFIENDPIQIPHIFNNSEDIEIAALLTATIAWGQRSTIIKNGQLLMEMMDMQPYNFIMQSTHNDFKPFLNFKHRTFNGEDCLFFLNSIKNIYSNYNGLYTIFYDGYKKNNSIYEALIYFRNIFFKVEYPSRTTKHISDVTKNSAAKRLNMFLRWMVRKDDRGVDFGIWNTISQKDLYIPLDVHTGTVARKLGLLNKKQNDWQAATELTNILKKFDPDDPIKYDFALFGLGAFEK